MRRPAMRLNNADLPTFGRPTMAINPRIAQLVAAVFFELAPEERLNVPLDFSGVDLPPGFGQRRVFVYEDVRNDAARMLPFIDNLIQHARIRMLRGKTQA